MSEATTVTEPIPVSPLEDFVRIPGVFRRSEIEEVLVPGAGFHVEHAGAALPGTELFYVYRQLADVNGPASWLGSPGDDDRPHIDEPSLGERKARHREDHLCLKCSHHLVCGMAKSLDPNLLVTIASCLGFEPDAGDDADGVCELTPIEPLTLP
jgi:hypothetical protein